MTVQKDLQLQYKNQCENNKKEVEKKESEDGPGGNGSLLEGGQDHCHHFHSQTQLSQISLCDRRNKLEKDALAEETT
jgi:hypothetical protein